jgi:hypothetical protein
MSRLTGERRDLPTTGIYIFFRTRTIVLTYAERPQILPFFSFSFSLIF